MRARSSALLGFSSSVHVPYPRGSKKAGEDILIRCARATEMGAVLECLEGTKHSGQRGTLWDEAEDEEGAEEDDRPVSPGCPFPARPAALFPLPVAFAATAVLVRALGAAVPLLRAMDPVVAAEAAAAAEANVGT